MEHVEYDIPDSVMLEKRSKAFEQFLQNWFVNSVGLRRYEVDLSFLKDLTPSEHELAVGLLRRNLHFGYTHIVEGIALLDDEDSVPALREMLASSSDLSRKLTIAGSLWRLVRDPSFPKLIQQMVTEGSSLLKQAHFEQIFWLDSSLVINFLIDLLTDSDSFVSFLALSRLNEIDGNQRYLVGRKQLPKQAEDFLHKKNDISFNNEMSKKLDNYAPANMITATTEGLVAIQLKD